ncbi:MAG TPA: hypothetical protein VGN82_08105 [Bosea sp. (in: a-proteobacteria)]|jgi:hypothetical protein|uniref:hypothetical protein n=1 Tax=Bosea sp. (in: a-proteobacteria) TaxID=1871050 RepID=UPI002E0DD427|nr:hypothetical protein [Bosea sp. (in: a-proteobacteria)]
MPFRSIVAEPHELAKLANAFDAAWIGVNSVHTIGRVAQKRARSRLAAIILELWREDPSLPLGGRAVDRFFAGDRLPQP